MMKGFLTGAFFLILSVSCGSGGDKGEDVILETLHDEGYPLEGEDTTSFDFSSKPIVGDLERRLIEAGLVDIKAVIPDVFVDLKYSTTDNFFGKDVYGKLENCYIQPVVAE